jgi:hypothetical protein
VQISVLAGVVLELVSSFWVLEGLWFSVVQVSVLEVVLFWVWLVLHRRQVVLLHHCQWLVVGSVMWSVTVCGCSELSQV